MESNNPPKRCCCCGVRDELGDPEARCCCDDRADRGWRGSSVPLDPLLCPSQLPVPQDAVRHPNGVNALSELAPTRLGISEIWRWLEPMLCFCAVISLHLKPRYRVLYLFWKSQVYDKQTVCSKIGDEQSRRCSIVGRRDGR